MPVQRRYKNKPPAKGTCKGFVSGVLRAGVEPALVCF